MGGPGPAWVQGLAQTLPLWRHERGRALSLYAQLCCRISTTLEHVHHGDCEYNSIIELYTQQEQPPHKSEWHFMWGRAPPSNRPYSDMF